MAGPDVDGGLGIEGPRELRQVRRFSHEAMATVFEMWLAGDDPEHLEAVGQAALDEIERIERLLSRFDPAAEVARVNRMAAEGPVLVEYELFALLEDCRLWRQETEGFFDVCAVSGVSLEDGVQLDISRRTVKFLDPRVQLDFGALGKGYALDAAAHVLDRFAVTSALLHGGTSSVRPISHRRVGTIPRHPRPRTSLQTG